MTNFTPFLSLIGGMLIGLSALVFLVGLGRIAGISGIYAGVLEQKPTWLLNTLFLAAIPLGAFLISQLLPDIATISRLSSMNFEFDLFTLIIAGFLVGFGTKIGGGCTSGHGICGISRLSSRSFTAVAVFVTTAMITVYLTKGI